MTEVERKIILNKLNKQLLLYYNMQADSLRQKSMTDQIKQLNDFVATMIPLLEIHVDLAEINDEINQAIFSLVTSYERTPTVYEYDYKPWLNEVKDLIVWDYSGRYSDYLMEVKNWGLETVNDINESTDVILDHCGNPRCDGSFAVKGLVVGDIQSGKTANYTSLINKAIDVGYKFIIVLAGLTNDLRAQTQKRLDKEVIGYQTKKSAVKGNKIGVGKVRELNKAITCLTDANDGGDLRSTTITYSLTNDAAPLLVVVKKNVNVLKALKDFITENPAFNRETSKLNCPTLIIDDEADQASINTNKASDREHATAINHLIRDIILSLNRYTYVGYTATPFANVFVDPDIGDVFPDNFIVNLKTSSNYSGVYDFFGNKKIDSDAYDDFNVDLFAPINQEANEIIFRKPKDVSAREFTITDLPIELKEAITHFLIASAIKLSRGIEEHSSMLIHVCHFTNPNSTLKPLVIAELERQITSYKFKDKGKTFKKFWEEKIKPISIKRMGNDFNDTWKKISKSLDEVFSMILRENTVSFIGGKSEDVIDYDSTKKGIHIIIGGNKLSRGLTLDGLIVSYYFRNSKAYDTLLQMGRWFGYRQGWLDLCRIYTTYNILNDFISSAEALEELRKDVGIMNNNDRTPRNYGLKVLSSPSLIPTSYGKLRNSKRQMINFSGVLQQTISFDKDYKEFNRELTLNFLNKYNYKINKRGSYIFRHVPGKDVVEYLSNYKQLNSDDIRISVDAWVHYINRLLPNDELTDWTVILHSLSESRGYENKEQFGKFLICKPRRKDRNIQLHRPYLGIKVLTDPGDFINFYEDDDPMVKEVTRYDSTNPRINATFPPKQGLLTIYVFDITDCNDNKAERKIVDGGNSVIGLGLWFPKSNLADTEAMDYYMNKVSLEEIVKSNEPVIDQEAEDAIDD